MTPADSKMAGKKDTFHSDLKRVGVLTTVPIVLLVGPAVGYWFGGLIDRKFQLFPWFTIGFVILGFLGSGREVFRLLKDILKEDKES